MRATNTNKPGGGFGRVRKEVLRMYIITAMYQGSRITRKAFSDLQAFTIINQLSHEGCTEIGMREEDHAKN